MTFAAQCDPAAGLALALAGLLLGSRHQSRPFRFLDGTESLAPELRSAVSSVRRARLIIRAFGQRRGQLSQHFLLLLSHRPQRAVRGSGACLCAHP